MSGADIVIGVRHTLEDVVCADRISATLRAVGSILSATGIVLGNIPSTKYLTVVSGSITVSCRSIWFYCKNYGTYWGCTAALAEGGKRVIKYTVNKLTN